jgi:hypothetical protein
MIALNRKFSPPRSSDVDQWKKIEFLIEHGFRFQSVYEIINGGGAIRIKYPKTLAEAKELVEKLKSKKLVFH